jgi:DNA (cytosine-5)-methyltransferase 1
MKVLSLFSGIGGFDLAMRNLGHEIIGACEIDQYARSVYQRQFPGVPIYEDATKIKPEELPDFDIICAGFPCQAFSIAGKRRGFEDTRGSLFFEIARIAKEKKPSLLLLENVKGLLSHDKGETFRTIISTLDEMGYDAEWQVLNSKYFVPQNRERIFIIGHLRGERTRQVFPVGDFNSETDKPKPKIVGVVNDKGNLRQVEQATCLDANYWKGCDNHAQRTMIYLSNTNANMKQRIQERKETWTLGTGTDFGIKDGMRIRKLTPIECERLQGFPDNWTIGSDTQRYRQCGNAVTVDVVEYIAKELRLG